MSLLSGWWSGGSKEESATGDSTSSVADTGKAALGGLWNVVNQVTSKVSETMEKGVPNVFDDFNKEEEKFKKERRRHTDAAVPPWVGYNEEEMMRTQILALSTDKRNFLRNPPPGVQFHFDFNVSFPIALATLKEDPMLEKMRFDLVPKQVTEEAFWRNYFYRVSLIKQSSQLTSLAAAQKEEVAEAEMQQDSGRQTPHSDSKQDSPKQPEEVEEEHEEVHEEDGANEFISDTFVTESGTTEEAVPEWEKELQEDLKEFGIDDLEEGATATDGDGKDQEEWEKEIEAMLEMDDSLKSS